MALEQFPVLVVPLRPRESGSGVELAIHEPGRTEATVPDLNSLRDLFEDEMQGIYDAEKQVLQTLAHVTEAVLDEQLRDVLSAHLAETHVHIERLEDAFHLMGLSPRRRRSAGMAGILDEGSELLVDVLSPDTVRDAAFIASCQRVEHYEIAAYGTLIAWAKLLHQYE